MRTILSTRPCAARRGFTLIEILSVLVILGIVSAMIIPQIGTHDDSKVASAARAMMADIIYAQNSAVAKQQYFYVVFDKTNNKYDVCSSVVPVVIITHPVSLNPYEQVFGKEHPATLHLHIHIAEAARDLGQAADALKWLEDPGFDEPGRLTQSCHSTCSVTTSSRSRSLGPALRPSASSAPHSSSRSSCKA